MLNLGAHISLISILSLTEFGILLLFVEISEPRTETDTFNSSDYFNAFVAFFIILKNFICFCHLFLSLLYSFFRLQPVQGWHHTLGFSPPIFFY